MDIMACVNEINDYLVRCRRHLYENPELSDKEFNTLAFIRSELTEMGVDFVDVPQGGIMGFIEGAVPGKTIFLRADMDALPIQEEVCNDKQPKVCLSKVPGVAHLCGHDAHVAMLLGAAKILSQHREEIEGKIILFFEQGEEYGHGDIYMMRYIQGNNIHIDGCWAIHVVPDLPAGTLGLIPGGVFAGAIGWWFTLAPKEGTNGNPVNCAASIVNAFHTARLSALTPFEALTITCCLFKTDANAGTCTIAGSCRFYDRDRAGIPMRQAMRRIVETACEAYDCTPTYFGLGGPKEGLLNDPTCCAIAQDAVTKAVGPAHVASKIDPTMYGESFSLLSSYYPSMFALLGMQDEDKGFTGALHNPHFEANEAALPYGAAATVAYALAFLKHKEAIPFEGFQGDFDAFLKTRAAD